MPAEELLGAAGFQLKNDSSTEMVAKSNDGLTAAERTLSHAEVSCEYHLP
jgi:hypothetical protein